MAAYPIWKGPNDHNPQERKTEETVSLVFPNNETEPKRAIRKQVLKALFQLGVARENIHRDNRHRRRVQWFRVVVPREGDGRGDEELLRREGEGR